MTETQKWQTILKTLRIPPPRDSARRQAVAAAVQVYRQAASDGGSSARESTGLRRRWRLTPALGFIGIAVLALLLEWSWRGSALPGIETTERDQLLLAEFSQLFPDQLQAVVMRNGAIEPRLSERPGTWQQLPVLIRLRKGDEEIRVISFSGQRVELALRGSTLSIEALGTADDKVLLIVNDRPALDRFDGYDIDSQLLGVSL